MRMLSVPPADVPLLLDALDYLETSEITGGLCSACEVDLDAAPHRPTCWLAAVLRLRPQLESSS
jgi:hypothetical protein